MIVRFNVFLSSANLICRGTDISECFRFEISRVDCIYFIAKHVFLFSTYFIVIPVFHANNVNPDQTPFLRASDHALHYFSLYLLEGAKRKY